MLEAAQNVRVGPRNIRVETHHQLRALQGKPGRGDEEQLVTDRRQTEFFSLVTMVYRDDDDDGGF